MKEACGINQLCSGIKRCIAGAIHAMHELFVRSSWDLLLVYAKKMHSIQLVEKLLCGIMQRFHGQGVRSGRMLPWWCMKKQSLC